MKHPLIQLRDDQKNGIIRGICSICSANKYVIEAAIDNAARTGEYVLIEATANQVNQFGGYTGMLPIDYKNFVVKIAERRDFDLNKIILGGDHLGPLTWKNETSDLAMPKAEELIRQFVMAGFTKIHIDTSMHLQDDDSNEKLSDNVIAKRGAELASVAEKAYTELQKLQPDTVHPVYIVGSEVPIPGGPRKRGEELRVKKEEVFSAAGLDSVWSNVIGVVVQPGVEFSDEKVDEYNREAARDLVDSLSEFPNLVFEGHSTDYQTMYKLKEMVQDSVAILKVGPALTFALREALFALNLIEEELLSDSDVVLSNFNNVLESAMLENPGNWQNHYHGSVEKLKLKRRFSMSDRARYYLPVKEVNDSVERLLSNLKNIEIPLTLLSQYMPVQYTRIRDGKVRNEPVELLKDRVVNCINEYDFATRI